MASAHATDIGPNQTVTSEDPSIIGKNINFHGKLTTIGRGTETPYDTGAALVSDDFSSNPDFLYSLEYTLGTGPNQVRWTGSGGFIGTSAAIEESKHCFVAIRFGNDYAPTLTWGQRDFVPSGCALVLGGIWLENGLNLGTDPTATRQIDIVDLGSAAGTYISQIRGTGNLLVQAYGPAMSATGPMRSLDCYVEINGTLNVRSVELDAGVSATKIYLAKKAALFGIALNSGTDLEMADSSNFTVPNSSSRQRESLGQLNCLDPTSTITVGSYNPFVGGASGVLIVRGGYFAGKLTDGVTTDHETQLPNEGASLIKTGPGFFTLASDNSVPQPTVYGTFRGYSVGTTVEQGTLLVTNSTGSATGTGSVTITVGGNLGGDGHIAPSAGHRLYVGAGGMVDLRASDPAHPMSDPTHALDIMLVPETRATFAIGSSFGFNLNGDGRSNRLAFSGLTANQTQVFLNNNAVAFTKLPAAQLGIYTIMTFDQGGAYSGTLAPQAGCKFIYAPKAVQVQIF